MKIPVASVYDMRINVPPHGLDQFFFEGDELKEDCELYSFLDFVEHYLHS
jgi:hypothetical protein